MEESPKVGWGAIIVAALVLVLMSAGVVLYIQLKPVPTTEMPEEETERDVFSGLGNDELIIDETYEKNQETRDNQYLLEDLGIGTGDSYEVAKEILIDNGWTPVAKVGGMKGMPELSDCGVFIEDTCTATYRNFEYDTEFEFYVHKFIDKHMDGRVTTTWEVVSPKM